MRERANFKSFRILKILKTLKILKICVVLACLLSCVTCANAVDMGSLFSSEGNNSTQEGEQESVRVNSGSKDGFFWGLSIGLGSDLQTNSAGQNTALFLKGPEFSLKSGTQYYFTDNIGIRGYVDIGLRYTFASKQYFISSDYSSQPVVSIFSGGLNQINQNGINGQVFSNVLALYTLDFSAGGFRIDANADLLFDVAPNVSVILGGFIGYNALSLEAYINIGRTKLLVPETIRIYNAQVGINLGVQSILDKHQRIETLIKIPFNTMKSDENSNFSIFYIGVGLGYVYVY